MSNATITAEVSELQWCTHTCQWGETEYNQWKSYVEDNARTKSSNECLNDWRKALWALIMNVTWEEAARRFNEGDDLYTEKKLGFDTRYTRISLIEEMRNAIREDAWNSDNIYYGDSMDYEEDFHCDLDEEE